jgi:hypothetical protein
LFANIDQAEISDITEDDFNKFFFKIGSSKYTFQADTATDRASWIVAIESKATEAKGLKEAIVGSEGYKAQLEKYGTLTR